MATTKWVLDPTHSEVTFKVKHLMISNVKGEFRNFSATIDSEGDDFSNAKVNATVETASIFTNNEDRDNHLRSADFFNAETNKEITFTGTSFEKTDDDDEFELKGDLTINGVTKPVTLEVEFGGINQDPWGNTKAGFTFEGKLNREDFGLTWNAALETGGVMVSKDVKIAGELQFVKQA